MSFTEIIIPYHEPRYSYLVGEDRYGILRQPVFIPWLIEHFGPRFYNQKAPTWRWIFREDSLHEGCQVWRAMFRDRRDAMLFKLTWL